MTARLLIAVLFASVAIGVVNIDAIGGWWRAMYPRDAEQQTALQLCYIENHQFNRMSAEARHDCYGKWLPILAFLDCVESRRCLSGVSASR
jgi:hypothetical protein